MLTIKITLLTAVSLLLFSFASNMAAAQTLQDDLRCGANNASGEKCDDKTNASQSLSRTIKNIINVFSAIIGAVAVVMIVLGGFRYVTSAGNDQAVQGAKNTIMYALIGLVIVALAQIIVQFVLKETTRTSSSSPAPAASSAPAPPPSGRPF